MFVASERIISNNRKFWHELHDPAAVKVKHRPGVFVNIDYRTDRGGRIDDRFGDVHDAEHTFQRVEWDQQTHQYDQPQAITQQGADLVFGKYADRDHCQNQ